MSRQDAEFVAWWFEDGSEEVEAWVLEASERFARSLALCSGLLGLLLSFWL
jgi:hypothetical protein